MHTYEEGTTYAQGEMVHHDGNLYIKTDDSDTSLFDDTSSGWQLVENTNLDEYQPVEQALSSYESRREAHTAEVLAALEAEGLDPDDVKAVLNAS